MNIDNAKKFVTEARKLAEEIDNGRFDVGQLGSHFTFHRDGSPCCVLGHLYSRCGLTSGNSFSGINGLLNLPHNARWHVAAIVRVYQTNDAENYAALHDALQGLADTVEAEIAKSEV